MLIGEPGTLAPALLPVLFATFSRSLPLSLLVVAVTFPAGCPDSAAPEPAADGFAAAVEVRVAPGDVSLIGSPPMCSALEVAGTAGAVGAGLSSWVR